MGELGRIRPSTRMATGGRRPRIVLLTVVALLALPAIVPAAVTVTTSLSETLYSTVQNEDCSKLHALKDQGTGGGMDELPMNIVRVHATVPGVPDDQVTFHWSLEKPISGVLIADKDIAGNQSATVIQGICAKFGSEVGGPCVLSGDGLRAYSQPSILWIAPTCDILPTNTGKPFHGGRVRFKVKAVQGKRKLGKGAANVGFGRVASVTLFVDGKNGLHKPSGIAGGFRRTFSANTNPNGQTLPQVREYVFVNGGGDTMTVMDSRSPCTIDRRDFAACATMDYEAAGKYLATLQEVFVDDSALCDNLTVQVLPCAARGDVQISRRPHPDAYTPGSPKNGTVDVTVRLRNRSIAEGGLPPCDFVLASDTLSCSEEAEFSGGTSTKTTAFSFFELNLPTDTVRPGHSLVLFHRDNVPLFNILSDAAKMTDTWTANTVNAGSYDGMDKYRIKGRPDVPAPPQ